MARNLPKQQTEPEYSRALRPPAKRFALVSLGLFLTTPIWQVLSFVPFMIFAPAEVGLFAIASTLFGYPFGLIGVLIIANQLYRHFDRLKLWSIWRCILASACAGTVIVGTGLTILSFIIDPEAGVEGSTIFSGFVGIPPAVMLTLLFRRLLLKNAAISA